MLREDIVTYHLGIGRSAAHELAHTLGAGDKYNDAGGGRTHVFDGWEGTLMGDMSRLTEKDLNLMTGDRI